MSNDRNPTENRDATRDLPEGRVTNFVSNTLRARKRYDCTVEVQGRGLLIRREDGKEMKLNLPLWDLLHYLLGKTRAEFWHQFDGHGGILLFKRLQKGLDESAFTGDR